MSNKLLNPLTGKLVMKGGRAHKNFLKKLGVGTLKKKETSKKGGKPLAIFPNRDKAFHEKWTSKRARLNLPHPFRCVLSGPPNCGKTSMILNILMENRPFFEEVIVVHCDPEYTKEYDDVNAIMTDEIPPPDAFEGKKKTLVILDDLEYKNLPHDQKSNLDRLFGFVSTHKNISCCLTAQDLFNIPAGVRRCSNVWVLWKIDDLDSISTMARKINHSAKEIRDIFDQHIDDRHTSIMFDNTQKTPYPIRKNGTEVI